jgi:DNA segregation ATPase FtsK/SpoIIIE-like protein
MAHDEIGAPKLAGKLPKNDNLNGLPSIAAYAVEGQESFKVTAVVNLVVQKVVRDTANAEALPTRTATLVVSRIEPLAGAQAEAARRLMQTAREARTGLGGDPVLPGTVKVGYGLHDPEADRDPLSADNVVGTVGDMLVDQVNAITKPDDRPLADVAQFEDLALLVEAAALVVESQFASGAMLQRKLRVGFVTAGQLLDGLERFGVITPPGVTGARGVVTQPDQLAAAQATIRAEHAGADQ